MDSFSPSTILSVLALIITELKIPDYIFSFLFVKFLHFYVETKIGDLDNEANDYSDIGYFSKFFTYPGMGFCSKNDLISLNILRVKSAEAGSVIRRVKVRTDDKLKRSALESHLGSRASVLFFLTTLTAAHFLFDSDELTVSAFCLFCPVLRCVSFGAFNGYFRDQYKYFVTKLKINLNLPMVPCDKIRGEVYKNDYRYSLYLNPVELAQEKGKKKKKTMESGLLWDQGMSEFESEISEVIDYFEDFKNDFSSLESYDPPSYNSDNYGNLSDLEWRKVSYEQDKHSRDEDINYMNRGEERSKSSKIRLFSKGVTEHEAKNKVIKFLNKILNSESSSSEKKKCVTEKSHKGCKSESYSGHTAIDVIDESSSLCDWKNELVLNSLDDAHYMEKAFSTILFLLSFEGLDVEISSLITKIVIKRAEMESNGGLKTIEDINKEIEKARKAGENDLSLLKIIRDCRYLNLERGLGVKYSPLKNVFNMSHGRFDELLDIIIEGVLNPSQEQVEINLTNEIKLKVLTKRKTLGEMRVMRMKSSHQFLSLRKICLSFTRGHEFDMTIKDLLSFLLGRLSECFVSITVESSGKIYEVDYLSELFLLYKLNLIRREQRCFFLCKYQGDVSHYIAENLIDPRLLNCTSVVNFDGNHVALDIDDSSLTDIKNRVIMILSSCEILGPIKWNYQMAVLECISKYCNEVNDEVEMCESVKASLAKEICKVIIRTKDGFRSSFFKNSKWKYFLSTINLILLKMGMRGITRIDKRVCFRFSNRVLALVTPKVGDEGDDKMEVHRKWGGKINLKDIDDDSKMFEIVKAQKNDDHKKISLREAFSIKTERRFDKSISYINERDEGTTNEILSNNFKSSSFEVLTQKVNNKSKKKNERVDNDNGKKFFISSKGFKTFKFKDNIIDSFNLNLVDNLNDMGSVFSKEMEDVPYLIPNLSEFISKPIKLKISCSAVNETPEPTLKNIILHSESTAKNLFQKGFKADPSGKIRGFVADVREIMRDKSKTEEQKERNVLQLHRIYGERFFSRLCKLSGLCSEETNVKIEIEPNPDIKGGVYSVLGCENFGQQEEREVKDLERVRFLKYIDEELTSVLKFSTINKQKKFIESCEKNGLAKAPVENIFKTINKSLKSRVLRATIESFMDKNGEPYRIIGEFIEKLIMFMRTDLLKRSGSEFDPKLLPSNTIPRIEERLRLKRERKCILDESFSRKSSDINQEQETILKLKKINKKISSSIRNAYCFKGLVPGVSKWVRDKMKKEMREEGERGGGGDNTSIGIEITQTGKEKDKINGEVARIINKCLFKYLIGFENCLM